MICTEEFNQKGEQIMKVKKHGTAVIFLKTDLEKTPPFDENSLSEIQASVFSKLSENERKKS